MANPTVTITGCQPNPRNPSTGDSGNITFKSGDKKYFIDFGPENANISDQTFPLEVPANSEVHLNIKGKAPRKTYFFRILDADRQQCCPKVSDGPGEESPTVIIE